jgi:hypothetical protein
VVELGLSRSARDLLYRVVEGELGRAVDPELLTPCYLALQLGDRTLAAEIVAAWEAEVHRLRAAVDRCAARLRHELR